MPVVPKPRSIRWDDAHVRLAPLLLAVLRRLAREGFVHDVEQGMDLIHDFFIEAWPGVQRAYDPARGDLAPYATRAFANFARPRLVREARWREMLGDDAAVEPGIADDSEGAIDRARVREALASLPPEERALVLARFGDEPQSERVLARRAGVTRYRVREQLAVALARFSAALGESAILGRRELAVARALFQQGLSISGAATALGLTEAQVRIARRSLLDKTARITVEGP